MIIQKTIRFSLALLIFISFAFSTLLLPTNQASSLSGVDFDPGRIIDDDVFYDSTAMNTEQIQSFLNSKVPVCDTNGTKPIYGTTRAIYGSSTGNPAPYTCLKDYTESVNGVINTSQSLCKNSVSAGTKTAAQIIYDVSVACGINPKVIIVLLQKEQSLITDDWPWNTQYDKATGYYCPDDPNKPGWCHPDYAGFFNQVYNAAEAFNRYESNPQNYSYRANRNNNIYYHPSLGPCGSSNIFIENQATANLYIYTPYQPNDAALNNLYGSGDSCSAYGNRNFWRMFSDWFGSPTSTSTSDFLSLVSINDPSGNANISGLSSVGEYKYITRSNLLSYPSVLNDGNVQILSSSQDQLRFARLNHQSGQVEVVSYAAGSNFSTLEGIYLTSYPAVGNDPAVHTLMHPNGDISFIRLNHQSGNVEMVSYSADSNYQAISNYQTLPYPAVSPDGSVVPLYKPNGDFSLVNINHGSGFVEIVSYSRASNFNSLQEIQITPAPVLPDYTSLVPIFTKRW